MFLCYTEKNIRERKLILMKKVTIEMENGGVMTGELYPEIAG